MKAIETVSCVLQTFLGDILSDLPDVGNFMVSDRSTYESDPMTPMQRYLRRDPPEWAANRYTRAENAVRAMASTQEEMAFKIKSMTHLMNPALAVGPLAHLNADQLWTAMLPVFVVFHLCSAVISKVQTEAA